MNVERRKNMENLQKCLTNSVISGKVRESGAEKHRQTRVGKGGV